MDLRTLLLKWGSRVNVLHRLPGRLRLEISALRKVPPEKREFAQDLIKGMVLPEGISSIELSFVTGSVLLKYDPDRITERQVLVRIQVISNELAGRREELWSISHENGAAAIAKLNGVLDKANRGNATRHEDDSRS